MALTGRSAKNMVNFEELLMSPIVLDPFLKLRDMGLREGIDIKIASAFRSYERQEKIWNDKVLGKRPILNEKEEVLNVRTMDEEELLFAMAKYSAIPGTSRHHWGADLDIFDSNALPPDYKLKLVSSEYQTIFTKLSNFLSKNLTDCQFFYPFSNTHIAPEPWHIGHISSKSLEKEYTFAIFKQNIQESRFLLKKIALKRAEELFQNYFAIND